MEKVRSGENGGVERCLRASVATLRCKDGKVSLERGGADPDDLHLRGAVLPKKRNPAMAA